MEKFLKEYGVIILMYFVIILGVLLFHYRMNFLHMN